MKPASKFLLVLFCIFLVSLNNCKKSTETKLREAVNNYKSNVPGALETIKPLLIENASIKSFQNTSLITKNDTIYIKDNNKLNFLYPEETKISADFFISSFSLSTDYCVVTDGITLSIYSSGGSHQKDVKLGEKKNRIKSVLVSGDQVIYYKNFNIFYYDIVLNTDEKAIDQTFQPPYKKYYSVNLFNAGDNVGILAGIAGSYYLSLVNLKDEKVILKNLSLASSKLNLKGNKIHYIYGNSGRWELIQYIIDKKVKRTIHKFKSLQDIELADNYFIYETGSEIRITPYGEKSTFIPFKYQLMGKYNRNIVLKYDKYCYIVDPDKFFRELSYLKNEIPGIF